MRFLFRIVAVALVLGVGASAAAYYLRHQPDESAGGRGGTARARVGAAAETLVESIDHERIREAGAELAETIGDNVGQAGAALSDARLTAKIRSKIALDDTLAGSRLSVDTEGTSVTVRGTVRAPAQHERVLQLVKETAGVTAVVDRVTVERR
jgi:osmotically-inducible protein OsmY